VCLKGILVLVDLEDPKHSRLGLILVRLVVDSSRLSTGSGASSSRAPSMVFSLPGLAVQVTVQMYGMSRLLRKGWRQH
jgi:hypothetical protein